MKQVAWMLFGVLTSVQSAMLWSAVAQDNYPASPVRLVVGFPAGGAATDEIARLLAPKLSAQLNASVFVENRPGANSNIGTEFVAKSRPDGYTLLLNTSGVILSRALGEKLGYDILTDLSPVGLVATSAHALFVHPAVPANTLVEFIVHLKANPDKLTYGSGGTGNISHLAPLLFLQANGLSALHVPYKGGAQAVIDVVAGRVQFAMQNAGSVVPLAKDRRVRVLAVTSLKRSPLLPEVPALAESMPGFEIGNWFGVMAPAKTPPAIVRRLSGEIVKALQDPDVKTRLAQQNAESLGSTPEEYGAYLKSELDRWTKVINSAAIKPE